MKRQAPSEGYYFGAKRDYRHEAWYNFRNILEWRVHYNSRGEIKRNAHVLIMPSREGLEIPIAISYGFQEDHIHAVDRNPALLATAPWRKQYPHVQIYGSELERACERIAKKGIVLSVANLDLCGYACSLPMARAIQGTFQSQAVDSNTVFAVTMLRGRENGQAMQLLQMLAKKIRRENSFHKCLLNSHTLDQVIDSGGGSSAIMDFARLFWPLWLWRSMKRSNIGTIRHAEIYHSIAGSQTMIWAVYDLLSGL